jgi:preprotein translocase subunit SecA
MEDDLLRLFIPEMAMKVIEHTISDGESIKSRMVSKRIVGAQNKIEAKSTGNAPATSAEQWLKDNYVSG